MKNKTPIICARCGKEFAGGGWDEITYHECVKPTRTNADRIRSMSDDDKLAREIFNGLHKDGDHIPFASFLRWLKQEVE